MSGANALIDDPQWCGHWSVSLRTWTCPDCDRPVTLETRRRLEASPTAAPPGCVWVLVSGDQDLSQDGCVRGMVVGLFSDRVQIARLLIRRLVMGAEHIRDVMRRTHWYQGVFNDRIFQGWEEEPNTQGWCAAYHLYLERIDQP